MLPLQFPAWTRRCRSPDNAIRKKEETQRSTFEVLDMPQKMTMEVSKVLRLPRKLQLIFWQRRESTASLTHKTHLDTLQIMQYVGMIQSATPATRNRAMRRLTLRKLTTFATIAIGRAIGPSCGRLRKVARRWANTPSTPKPPEWNRNPCYAFWKKTITFSVNMLDYQLIYIAMIKTRTNCFHCFIFLVATSRWVFTSPLFNPDKYPVVHFTHTFRKPTGRVAAQTLLRGKCSEIWNPCLGDL